MPHSLACVSVTSALLEQSPGKSRWSPCPEPLTRARCTHRCPGSRWGLAVLQVASANAQAREEVEAEAEAEAPVLCPRARCRCPAWSCGSRGVPSLHPCSQQLQPVMAWGMCPARAQQTTLKRARWEGTEPNPSSLREVWSLAHGRHHIQGSGLAQGPMSGCTPAGPVACGRCPHTQALATEQGHMGRTGRHQARAHRVGWGPLLGGGVVGVLTNVELVGWKKMDVWLLEALEDGPWHSHSLSSAPSLPLLGGGKAAPHPRDLTFLHFLGELVMLEQSRHLLYQVLLQDGLHGHAPTTQTEVEVSKPEHPIEPGGDIRCKRRMPMNPALPVLTMP